MGLCDLKAELSQLDLVDQGPLLQQLSHDQFNFSPLLTPRLQPCCADPVRGGADRLLEALLS